MLKHLGILNILVIALFLRLGTFFFLHMDGDQFYYTCVAMKLDQEGFKGYNLQNIVEGDSGKIEAVFVEKNSPYTLLGLQKKQGFFYYDEPLFYSPPLFPYLISYSHKIFSPYQPFQLEKNHEFFPFFHQQDFYRDIVPVLFSLLTILLVYIFCLVFINRNTGLIASLLLSISPVDILCASRIWADCTLSFFMFTSALFFLLSNKRNNIGLAIISGIFCGLAILTKVSGLFVIIILGIYCFFIVMQRILKTKTILLNPELKHYLIFCCLALGISSPWFLKVYQTFGNPLHFPYQTNIESVSPWFYIVFHRPWFTYFVDILFYNPVWIFAIMGGALSFRNRIPSKIAEKPSDANNGTLQQSLALFLTLWILIPGVYLTHMSGKENRYMLPAYPAIAIFTSLGLTYTSQWLKQKSFKWGIFILYCALLGSLFYSAVMAIKFVDFQQVGDFLKPF